MDWLLAALFIALTSSLVLVFTYLNLYVQERQKYLALWLASWSLYAARFVLEALVALRVEPGVLLIMNQLSLLWSAAFLLWGTCLFSGKKLNGTWLALFVGGSIWIITGISFHLSSLWTTVPIFLVSAFTNVFTGVTLLRFREARGPAKLTTGWVFILWGLHKADYPLLRPLPWAAPFGYILSAVFGFISAVGIILVYLEKTKKELKASEEKYRSIFENAVEGIFQTTPEGRFLSANPAMARMCGQKCPEYMIGSVLSPTTQMYVDPDDRKRLQALLQEHGFVEQFETRMYLEDEARWVSLNVRAVKDGNGAIRFYEGSFQEITDRKRAEETLQQQSHLQELLMNMSATYINLPPEAVESEIDISLGEMAECVGASRAFVFEYGSDTQIMTATHEWFREGMKPRIADYQALPLAVVYPEWDVEAHRRGESIRIPDVMSLPPGFLKETLQRGGTRSGLYVPCMSEGECLGFVGFAWAEQHAFSANEERLLAVFANMLMNIRKRKHTEEALRESERKYHTLFDSANDAIFIMKGSLFIDCNRKTLELFGCDKEDIIGRSPMELSPEVQPDGLLSSEKASVRIDMALMGAPQFFEWRHLRMDGTPFDAEVSLNRVELGGDAYLLAIVRDVTQRKKAEEALYESEANRAAIMESTSDLIWSVDATDQFRILTFNTSVRENVASLAGTDVHPGVTPDDLHSPEISNIWKGLYTRCVTEGKIQTEYSTSKGSRTLLVSLNPIFRDGRIIAISVFGKDITERKMAEQALQESEEYFHQLFEQDEDALILFKRGTTEIIDVNPAVAVLYGYPKEELIASGPSALFSPDDFQRFQGILLSLEKDKPFTIKNILTRGRDAKRINVSVRGHIVRLQSQDVIYCDIRDITEQIRMKKETAIMQSKLIFANKMSSLGILVSSVAHEINNPNNFILFNSSLLQDVWKDATTILDEYQRENGEFFLAGLTYAEMREAVGKLLDGITGGSQRIKAIVNNLKDFARQDTGGTGRSVIINEVIAASVTMLNNQIGKLTKNFRVEYGNDLPEILGNSQQLEQVVINLLMNALEALPSKDSAILVTTSYDSSAGEIIVEIKDEGTGIPEDMLDKVMEPFFTTKQETGGTGLGLPISHSIIRDHKGSLQFQSAQGKGTRTFIRLPAPGGQQRS